MTTKLRAIHIHDMRRSLLPLFNTTAAHPSALPATFREPIATAAPASAFSPQTDTF
jgi:hypothetical protein